MIYLDSSALIRMLDSEHPSHPPLLRFLDDGDRWRELITSALTGIEVARVAVRERSAELRARADEFLAAIPIVPITAEVVARARGITAPVKSLDAIHLGTAAESRASELLSYDKRMQSVWAEEFAGASVAP